MDIARSGRFLAECRKKKGWTQTQLAERLGVTDKAVSRWETGRGFPDVALLKPISEALEITVSELLAGEPIDPEDRGTKAEDTILQALADSKALTDKIVNGAILAFGAIVLLWSLLFLGYDTSWVSIYSTIGTLFIAVAVFRMLRGRVAVALPAAAAVLLLAFGIAEARDYVAVRQHGMPPLYTISIRTTFPADGEKVIQYHKLFYDVYRYHADQPDEYYEIK